MNKRIRETAKQEIAGLSAMLKNAGLLHITGDGDSWFITAKPIPEKLHGDDLDEWLEENTVADGEDYAFESPDGLGFNIDILFTALARLAGVEIKVL